MILLDTHALVWLWVEPKRLTRRATSAIGGALAAGGIAIASISLWEIAMLIAARRIAVDSTPERWISRLLEETGAIVRELTPAIGVLATEFPPDFSRDQADRIIAATARAEGLSLVTSDEGIRASPLLRTIW